MDYNTPKRLKLKIDWVHPQTELDHIVLTMLVWYDIWKNNYTDKHDSKYDYCVRDMLSSCPLCKFYRLVIDNSCEKCFLSCRSPSSYYDIYTWSPYSHFRSKAAKSIYLMCKNKAKEIITTLTNPPMKG